MTRPPIPLSAPDIGPEEQRLVLDVLESGMLSLGPMLRRFEDEYAERFGSKFAIGVSSGTAGLHLSVIAAKVSDNDFVITSPFSFIASANAILYERGIPIFADVDPETLTIDPAKAAEAIDALKHRRAGWRTLLPPAARAADGELRAVLPVHIFGQAADMSPIMTAARETGTFVIEDACEAIGSHIDGVAAGRWGDTAVFAFFPNKQMTTGEGGMVLTDDEASAHLFRSLRNQGRGESDKWLRHERLGYNYRLDELSAALGLAQLRRLDELLAKRAAVAARYTSRLQCVDGVTLFLPSRRKEMSISWFLYVIRVQEEIDRDRLRERLAARGIPTRPYFWPIHLQPYYRERFGYRAGDFPHAEAAGRSMLSLPFHSNLAPDDIDYICECVAEEIAHCRSEPAATVGAPT